eukprot:Awhi_evm1s9745
MAQEEKHFKKDIFEAISSKSVDQLTQVLERASDESFTKHLLQKSSNILHYAVACSSVPCVE